MADAPKRVIIRGKGPAPAAAPQAAPAPTAVPSKAMGGPKVAAPPRKTAPAGLPPAVPQTAQAPAAQIAAVDPKMIAQAVADAVKPLLAQIEELKGMVAQASENSVNAVSVLHDVLVSAEILKDSPSIYDDPDKIFAYLRDPGENQSGG